MSAEGSSSGSEISRWEALEAESLRQGGSEPVPAPGGFGENEAGSSWWQDPETEEPPVTAAPSAADAASEEPEPRSDHQGADVMLADADHTISASIAQAMAARGWQVRHVDQGEQALAQFLARPPDCLVFDYSLPGLGGLDLLRQIAESGVAGGTRLVVNSTQTQAVHVQRARAMGAHRFLDRPVGSPDELIDAVAEQLDIFHSAGTPVERESEPPAGPSHPEPAVSGAGEPVRGLFAGDDADPAADEPPRPPEPRPAPPTPDDSRPYRSAFGRGGGPPGRVPKLS